ncbi:MAG TPA: hydrogenase maturation protease [Bacillota bacterium]|nr:hydrogenase maturation protease [Bacillota bacterium]
MKPIVVLGMGSRLMMDDGIGVNVVETLARESPEDEYVDYRVGETDWEYGLDLIVSAEYLILVDAAIMGKRPGEFTIFPLRELSSINSGISQHHLHFLEVMQQLDQQKRGIMIGIEPFQIDFHWGLSRELNELFDPLVVRIKDAIEKIKKKYREDRNLLAKD